MSPAASWLVILGLIISTWALTSWLTDEDEKRDDD